MAKPREKKAKPKPPENAPTVIAIKKLIEECIARLATCKAAAIKDGKLNKLDAKFRQALKRLKRAQRKLYAEAIRLRPKKAPTPEAAAPAQAAPAAVPAQAAPAAVRAEAAPAAAPAQAAPAA
ncbi:MAG: hypothetical protein NTW87_37415, partial [Planctomycetota bacterium]|nr:hypothetical protein [Planctomycetota bacterium]